MNDCLKSSQTWAVCIKIKQKNVMILMENSELVANLIFPCPPQGTWVQLKISARQEELWKEIFHLINTWTCHFPQHRLQSWSIKPLIYKLRTAWWCSGKHCCLFHVLLSQDFGFLPQYRRTTDNNLLTNLPLESVCSCKKCLRAHHITNKFS